MKEKALSMRPPLHPLLSESQSTSSCSDSVVKFPVTIWLIPSTAATVEKAQQLPEIPGGGGPPLLAALTFTPRYMALNSS
ncbi:unnamed protein product [Spirodela intermedia]|uniref:Uncharacterized protein n=1 Tax=Spirodela intermedia TaxID=51605 RepID=A0A7I8JJ54_SPIIN|nr:unnamed protein product [Spirodela intermedia]CAA6670197.1 unnamed protein product [Spirodela intermedia]